MITRQEYREMLDQIRRGPYPDDVSLKGDMIRYMNCPCRYFPSMTGSAVVEETYRESRERGQREGFVPVIVVLSSGLLRNMLHKSDDRDREKFFDFSSESIAEYRERMTKMPLKPLREMFETWMKDRRMEAWYSKRDWKTVVVGDMAGGGAVDQLTGYLNYATGDNCPLILAEIPVEHPWEVFAWLPFGDWNDCPDTLSMMTTAKLWFEHYRAVPAVVSHDILEFVVPEPVAREQAMELALEQLCFCSNVLDQDLPFHTVGMLADSLCQSHVWGFWWD